MKTMSEWAGREPEFRALRQRLALRVRDFEPAALVALLNHLGYDDDHIHFRSHDTKAAQPTLIDAIDFFDTPDALPWADDRSATQLAQRALEGKLPNQGPGPRWNEMTPLTVITLNLGLLAPQSPLPSYFFQYMDDPLVRGDAFRAYLRYFDDRLLKAHLLAQHPELDHRLVNDYPAHRRRLLHSLGLSSLCALHTLVAQIFPELEVAVERSVVTRVARCEGVTLGKSHLGGRQAFGGQRKVSSAGYMVRLRAADPMTPCQVPWGIEARSRIEKNLDPILSQERIEVQVVMETLGTPDSLTLGTHCHLGFGVLGRPKAMPGTVNSTSVRGR